MKDKYKVLVVNREEELPELIHEFQQTEAYKIDIITSAIEAYEKIRKEKYHIVLIDIDIPDKNGLELLQEIKNYDSLTQIIMTTKHSTMDKILSSLEYGANDYIVNPFRNSKDTDDIINYSIDKLERWRKAILNIID